MPLCQSTTTGAPLNTQVNVPNYCRGPFGNTMVLPVFGNNAALTTTATTPAYATSVCNGVNMYGLWVLANNVMVRTQHVTSSTSSTVSAHSWIFYPALAASGLTIVDGTLFTPPAPRPRVTPAAIRAGRRVVRRSIDIYSRFRGMDEARRFMRGEEIQFEGALYNYRVKKSVSVMKQAMRPDAGHIPYRLKAADKVTGDILASGCVVFPNLPIFDQLLALTFHISDPEHERELVKTTNWSPRLPATLALAA